MADLVSIIVSPIVASIIDTVVSLIKEEFRAIRGVKGEVEKLLSNLETIKAVLKDAEKGQLDSDGDESLKVWLRELKDAAFDAEDILDTFATETFLRKRKRRQLCNIRLRTTVSKTIYESSVAHEIKQISQKFDLIAEKREKFTLNESRDVGRSQSQNLPHTTSFVDKTGVLGRDSDKETLINWMLSNESDTGGDVSVIPITGMGGLGKTTLAQFVFNDERVKKHFELRMWVCVGVDFNLERILKEMIESHTKMVCPKDLTRHILESRILEQLAGKNFLLVLDDVWTNHYREWEPLRDLLKQGGKGSRVLVTARNDRVSEIMGTLIHHPLGGLAEVHCWSLFKRIAFKDCDLLGGSREELEGIGRELVGKCKGLPLAVKAIGGLLRGNVDVNKWKKISSHSIWELEEEENPKILPALKLSYDHLPSHLKQCFAYCSLFPKAYVFDRKELVKLWMALGFIQSSRLNRIQSSRLNSIQSSRLNSIEETGVEYFNELVMRLFFQKINIANEERYIMHDLIHELAISVSRSYCCHVKDNNSCILPEGSRHVSLICEHLDSHISQITEKCKKLRALLLPSKELKILGPVLDKMFCSLGYIRVLDLSSTSLSELPNSVDKLKLLRYLDLSRTEIRRLPDSICNLCNLQTLKLRWCPRLLELPEDLGNRGNLSILS